MGLIVCPTCNGSAYQGRHFCRNCHGAARGLKFGGYFLYWGRPLSDFDIKLRRLRGFVDDLISAIVLSSALVCIGLFFDYLFRNINVNIITLKFWINQTAPLKLFWFSSLAFLFLIYRLRTLKLGSRPVLSKKFGETMEPEEASRDDIKKLRRKYFLDISKSLENEFLQAVDNAYILAKKLKHGEMNLLHLFAALLRTRKAQYVFVRLGPEKYRRVTELVRRALGRLPTSSGDPLTNPQIFEALIRSYIESFNDRESRVDVLPLLLFAGLEDKMIAEILYELEIDKNKLRNTIAWIKNNEKLRKRLARFSRAAKSKPKGAMDRAMTAIATPALDRWSEDLTHFAVRGFLPPTIGREEQFESLFRVIESGRGALLVGEAGVGKNAIFYGLAERMVEENVPRALYDKRLILLNVAELVSGASGSEAHDRLLGIFHDLRKSGNTVLVVPHIERFVGVGADASQNDLAALFVNEMSGGNFICLASTDENSYRTKIARTSLGEVFEKIEVPEPKTDLAIQIVEAATAQIEAKHRIFFSYDAVAESVDLSGRYLRDRFLPDKALEILKEVAASVRKNRGQNKFASGEDVAKIIAEKTKIPLTSITREEGDKLLKLEDKLHERVIGQNDAVSAVARALRRARAELREAKRPIANFLFLGPTGVGKTETAKAVADIYFGNEKNMIRLDMSEYQEKASISRLIGAPGERGGGLLTEAARSTPFSLLLLDEIEKAHPDILNIFLQVMDDGRLTDNEGRTSDFTNIILIATSNAGTPFIQGEIQKGTATDVIRDRLVREELKSVFRPEFLNRFDGIIVFKPLSQDELQQITYLMLGKISRELSSKGISFEATDAGIRELAQIGFDPIFGARPMRRVITERVEDGIAKLLIENKVGRRDKIIYEPGGKLQVEKAKEL